MARYARFGLPAILLCLGLGCGGKSSRAPHPGPTIPPAPPGAVASPFAPPPAASLLDALAPAPRIRVGLSTSAELVRLSSSRPFRIGAESAWIETQEVLVEVEQGGETAEAASYHVELGSFPTEEAAARFRARAASELTGELTTAREAGTGRFSVRLGGFSTEEGARAAERELERIGFEGTAVRREVPAPRPKALRLLSFGRPPVRVPTLELFAVPSSAGAFLEVEGSPYRGYVSIGVSASGRFTIVNVAHLEDYLKGVVPAELSPEVFPEKEALKAQAIAARTYAVKRLGEFGAEGYDICATPACQVYRGVAVEHPLSSEAVDETAGEILTYQGDPVDALYTSTCGGRTENAENVFSSPSPYLVSRACFLESKAPTLVHSRNEMPLSLPAAMLQLTGVLGEPSRDGPSSYEEARRLIARAVEHLGQSPCWRELGDGSSPVLDLAAVATLLGEALCWERRLPFLLSPLDAERMVGVGERPLAYAVREGILIPAEDGIRPGRPVHRTDLVDAIYRLLTARGESLLKEARIVAVDPERLVLAEGTNPEENKTSMSLGSVRYLYRSLAGSEHYAPSLTLLPNDRVRYHAGEDGIDVLVLAADGGSFDRSSRFSHWVVRKSAEDLTRDVNLRQQVGEVLDLRPKRYGPSGRIAELEIVGRSASATLSGLAIRRALGIRENLFFFDSQRGPDGRVKGWVFTGRGWGHGVGLCQVGAYGMAAAGYDYRDILRHYYAGTEIQRSAAAR